MITSLPLISLFICILSPFKYLCIPIKDVVMDGKNIVKISVQRGTARPYYLAGKGVRPEGV